MKDTTFGFWMQTLADLELLDLELQGLKCTYRIDPINRTVDLEGDEEFIRLRIAHLEKVKGKPTLYSEFVDKFNDTNAYAFHNLKRGEHNNLRKGVVERSSQEAKVAGGRKI